MNTANCVSCGSGLNPDENIKPCRHGYLCEQCSTCPMCMYETLPLESLDSFGITRLREEWKELGYNK